MRFSFEFCFGFSLLIIVFLFYRAFQQISARMNSISTEVAEIKKNKPKPVVEKMKKLNIKTDLPKIPNIGGFAPPAIIPRRKIVICNVQGLNPIQSHLDSLFNNPPPIEDFDVQSVSSSNGSDIPFEEEKTNDKDLDVENVSSVEENFEEIQEEKSVEYEELPSFEKSLDLSNVPLGSKYTLNELKKLKYTEMVQEIKNLNLKLGKKRKREDLLKILRPFSKNHKDEV